MGISRMMKEKLQEAISTKKRMIIDTRQSKKGKTVIVLSSLQVVLIEQVLKIEDEINSILGIIA